MRIPVPPQIEPGAIRGDRLSGSPPDLTGPARAFGGLANALTGLMQEHQANQAKINTYNANLALERWSNDQAVQYQTDFDAAAPDGSDFLSRRDQSLAKSYQAVRQTIKDPELQAKADLVFEQVRGNQTLKGLQDVKKRQTNYVMATTGDSINQAVNGGQITDEAQFNDYYEHVVKPRIDSVISDPLERQQAYAVFGKQLGEAFLRNNPRRVLSPAMGDEEYLARLAQIESGGNPYAVNASSGARGLFQFIPSTARQYGLSDPHDPAQATAAARRLTADNRAYLRQQLGREPSPGELYLAHQQGAGGAAKLLANPTALATEVLGTEAVIQNGGAPGMTAAQFAAKWINKFEGTAPAPLPVMAVAKPTTGIWEHVSDTEWTHFANQAEAADKDAMQARKAALREEHDELVKSGYDLVVDGALPEQWLADNRETLTASEYRLFSNAIQRQNSGAAETDRKAYLAFLDRAAKDDDQDAVQDDAVAAYGDGHMSKTDFNKVMSLSRATTKHRAAKPWLDDVRSVLSARLAPLDRDDTQQYTRRLDGLFALDDWVEANPQATRDEVKKKANEIAKDFAGAATEDLRAGLDMPQYSTVGRYAMSMESIALSAQKLAQAFKEGKIGEEELNREAALLKRWKSVLDEEARHGQ